MASPSEPNGSETGPDASRRLHLLLSGRVKRVRFRLFVKRHAESLGLVGWVRNKHRDRLEILAEGPKSSLDTLFEAVKQGPPGAAIDAVDAQWSAPGGRLHGFRIRWLGFL